MNHSSISLSEVIADDGNRLYRPTFARISTAALEHNFRAFRALAPRSKLLAVVKADAYGHGLLRCAQLFAELGADCFGVGFVEEGIALRRAGIRLPVLVLGGIVGSQIALFIEYDLDLTASSVFKLEAIELAARESGNRARVQLKLDTGMNRIGQNWRTAEQLFVAAKRSSHIELTGLYSHLATAEADDPAFARLQLERFRQVIELADAHGIRPELIHIANSAGAIRFPASHYSLIRPGLGLYGQHGSESLQPLLPLVPALSLVSQIVYLKRVRAGEGVSYGHLWHAPCDSWVATVPVGYGDGFPRSLTGKSQVLIGGRRYPIVGAICMDQFMVNLGEDRYPVGAEVVVWGKQLEAEIPLWELCRHGGFIPYELPIYLTGRVPRVFV
ncbi:alanine racemase [candidate division KSB1 bacterium]|nr:alanine racemase [candidate division KSB1 bacterium]